MAMMNSAPQIPQPNPPVVAEKQVNRACEACRLLKVRCLPDETGSTAKCQRCNKSGRMCVYAAQQKRRQRIRTDTRVAELERQIRDMRAMLTGGENSAGEKVGNDKVPAATASKESNQSIEGDKSSIGGDRSSSGAIEPDGQTSRRTSQSRTPEKISSDAPTLVEMAGNEFGLLATETADWLFNSFKNELVHHFPGVIISPDTTPEEMRKSKPILFQAVVTAAAYQLDPDVFLALFHEMTKIYAYRIFLNGEKSLEIVQAMNTSVVWYCPPDDGCEPGNLQFYQYIHMAATMAVDLGIGTDLDLSAKCLEECRTLLACYLNCSGYVFSVEN
jgi:Fungal Zn(2)-Cys(6) binuclear cluster domain